MSLIETDGAALETERARRQKVALINTHSMLAAPRTSATAERPHCWRVGPSVKRTAFDACRRIASLRRLLWTLIRRNPGE